MEPSVSTTRRQPDVSARTGWRAAVAAVWGLLVLGLTGACGSQPQPQPASVPEYRPTTTVRELMQAVIAPSATVIWDAVETSTTAKGVEHKEPRTDADWETVRRSAVMLVEASNLLLIPGRPIARPEERADAPDVELHPAEIATLVDRSRPDWVQKAHALHDAARVLLSSIEKKDVKGLFDNGAAVYNTCESCHRTYWYPENRSGAMKPSDR